MPRPKPRKQSKPKKRKKEPPHMRDIRRLQQTTSLLIPKLPFSRLVREIISQCVHVIRMTPDSLSALQEASEMYLTQLLEDAYRCSLHRKRVTLHPLDIQLVRFLRGRSDPGNN